MGPNRIFVDRTQSGGNDPWSWENKPKKDDANNNWEKVADKLLTC